MTTEDAHASLTEGEDFADAIKIQVCSLSDWTEKAIAGRYDRAIKKYKDEIDRLRAERDVVNETLKDHGLMTPPEGRPWGTSVSIVLVTLKTENAALKALLVRVGTILAATEIVSGFEGPVIVVPHDLAMKIRAKHGEYE